MGTVEQLYELLNQIPVTSDNQEEIEEIKQALSDKNYITALTKIKNLKMLMSEAEKEKEDYEDEEDYEEEENAKNGEDDDENINILNVKGIDKNFKKNTETINLDEEIKKGGKKYPKELSNFELEKKYIGMLINEPKLIVRYYFIFQECYFESDLVLNLYKTVLFTDGGDYTPEKAKNGFNFAKDVQGIYDIKFELKEEVANKNYDMEKIYTDLKKLFILRKKYTEVPIANIQEKIEDIANYDLYDQMSVEEVESAINQVEVTEKFKQSILNVNLTEFLEKGESNLSNGLSLPFPILTQVFKGIRKGETMAIAMPSNAGKSRFTVNLAAYTSLIHKKKVLIISNEMSEEKMRLTLITTILNHPEIQKLHGQQLSKTEGEILEFKFRPDNKKGVTVDENGFAVQEENETRTQFVKRLTQISSEFNKTIAVTDWINKQINNSVYFINITDHTNDELQKVIMNYYYKEKIEYVFYDTLKTDTANIGNGEEIKRTATILSNLAQNFGIFICSTLQLTENKTNPINLDINDLAVSRTVKEVLDTLCLVKQIPRDMYDDFHYSEKEVDTKFFDLEKSDDPDERYYACVVDKNRAGAKPKLLFGLNLAYNRWEELGYLSLK